VERQRGPRQERRRLNPGLTKIGYRVIAGQYLEARFSVLSDLGRPHQALGKLEGFGLIRRWRDDDELAQPDSPDRI